MTSYAFSNVTANHTIAASFAASSSATGYKITISNGPGAGNPTSGNSTAYVGNGESFTYYIYPYVGYKVADVKVDGVSVGAREAYLRQRHF